MKKSLVVVFILIALSLSAEEEKNSLFDVLDEVEEIKQENENLYSSIPADAQVYIESLQIIINGRAYDSKDFAEYENEERPGNSVVRYGSTLATVMRWVSLREQDRMELQELESLMADTQSALERAAPRFESVEYTINATDSDPNVTAAVPLAITISLSDGYRWAYAGGSIYFAASLANFNGKDRNISTTLGYNRHTVYYRDNQLANAGKNENGYGKTWFFYDVAAYHRWNVPFLTGEEFSFHKLGMFIGVGANLAPSFYLGARFILNYNWIDNTVGSAYDSWKLPGVLDSGTIEFITNPYMSHTNTILLPESKSNKKILQGEHSLYTYWGIQAPIGFYNDFSTDAQETFFVKGELFTELRYRYKFLLPNFIILKGRFGMSNESLVYANMFSVSNLGVDSTSSWVRRNSYPLEISRGYSVLLLTAEYALRFMDIGIISTDVYGFLDYGGTSMRYYPDPDSWRLVPGVGARLNINAPVYLSLDIAFGFGSSLLGYDDGNLWSWVLDVSFVL